MPVPTGWRQSSAWKYSKVIRGFGGAAISATQDLSDFFGLEDGRYGRAIINNSKNKIILNLEPDEAEFVRDTLKLTKTEIRSITRFERGEALICSNNSKVPVIIKASKEEQEMITTDRAELEAILRAAAGGGLTVRILHGIRILAQMSTKRRWLSCC